MEWQPTEEATEAGETQTYLIPLTKGQCAVIDEESYSKVCGISWYASEGSDGNGYYAVGSSGIRMHRLIMNPGVDEIVDHIDGDGLNNTLKNLRVGTQSQNCVNRKITPGKHLRGARKKGRRWQAYIKFRGKQRSLGYYDTEQEAHEAYLEEGARIHGGWMPLPEPPGDD